MAVQPVRQRPGLAARSHAYPFGQSEKLRLQVPLPSQVRLARSLRVLQNGVPQEVPGEAKAHCFWPLQRPPQLFGITTIPPSGGLIDSASGPPPSIAPETAASVLPAPPAPPVPPLPAPPPVPVVIENPAHSPSGSVFAGYPTHRPVVFLSAQEAQVSWQAFSQQTSSAQNPLPQVAAVVQFAPSPLSFPSWPVRGMVTAAAPPATSVTGPPVPVP